MKRRRRSSIPKPGLDQERFCLCGCGQKVTRAWNYGLNRPMMWVSGIHYMRTMRPIPSNETRLKMSESLRKFYQSDKSKESIEQRVKKFKETYAKKRKEGTNHFSKESKERMLAAQIGKHKGVLNAMYGRRHSKKTRERMSKSMIKVWSERRNLNLSQNSQN